MAAQRRVADGGDRQLGGSADRWIVEVTQSSYATEDSRQRGVYTRRIPPRSAQR